MKILNKIFLPIHVILLRVFLYNFYLKDNSTDRFRIIAKSTIIVIFDSKDQTLINVWHI